MVLICMSRADPWLLRGQQSIEVRGHCSLRTRLQTRLPGDRLVGVGVDLWTLWKFGYQGLLDKLCLPEICLSLKLKKTSATSDWITWQCRNVWSVRTITGCYMPLSYKTDFYNLAQMAWLFCSYIEYLPISLGLFKKKKKSHTCNQAFLDPLIN